MKNINRDYLVIVDARTAKITPPKDMKFFMTDENTSNIFFKLVFEDVNDKDITSLINEKAKEEYDIYSLTLRVVKPNYDTKEVKIYPLNQNDPCLFVADLTSDFINVSGICECELFIDAHIEKNGVQTLERNTTDSFKYEVLESIFFNLDDKIYDDYNKSTTIKDYINGLVTGNVSLSGYATYSDLNIKADREHTHSDYITQNQLENTIADIDIVKINLDDFYVSNSISINRRKYTPIGQYSTAIGDDTVASGHASYAEGYQTQAREKGAHAEGLNTKASGLASHAEGYNTTAIGAYQHVQGKYNIADVTYAHIVGNGSENEPSNAHTLDWDGNAWFAGNVKVGADNLLLATKDYVDGEIAKINVNNGKPDEEDPSYNDTEIRNLINNKADKDHTHDEYVTDSQLEEILTNVDVNNMKFTNLYVTNSISMNRLSNSNIGTGSTAIGASNVASGDQSFAEGFRATASGNCAHAEGNWTKAEGFASHAEGRETVASKQYAHAEGCKAIASGESSHAEGYKSESSGVFSHAEGDETIASGQDSHAEGYQSEASGAIAHAEGQSTIASGQASHAEGLCTIASGEHSHAEGLDTKASGEASHAEGCKTQAIGQFSHAEGDECEAHAYASHAEGCYTTVKGKYSHVEGLKTEARGEAQHVQGRLNIIDEEGRYAHIVGNGESYTALSNAHTLDWSGNAWYQGDVYVGGTSQDNGNKLLSTNDIYFTEDGDLAITINGVTKYFTPKELEEGDE